jgi:hypothetical protein
MRFRLSAAVAALCLSACGSAPDESKVGGLDFYDFIAMKRSEYALALDGGRERAVEAVRLAQEMKIQIDRRYEAIVQRAATETESKHRELAVAALGLSQRPEAVAHLEAYLSDPAPEVRGTAAASIGFLNPTFAPLGKIEQLLQDSDPYVRLAALFGLKLLSARHQKPSVLAVRKIEILAKEDGDKGVRNEAVLALGAIKDETSVEILHRYCLVDEEALVRGNAAMVLAGFGKKARPAVPALIERLKDGETGVVERAHFSLKTITGLEADRQYGTWVDWLKEISQVLEYFCKADGEVSSVPGPCPKCGITMEPRAISEAVWACPVHADVVLSKPGRCYKCQKELAPRKMDSEK